MLGTIVMRWVAEVIFEAASASGSQYRSEIRRYLRDRGLPTASEPFKLPTR
jgi:hypothetical protein